MKNIVKVGIICLLLGAVNVIAQEDALYVWGGFSPEKSEKILSVMKSQGWADHEVVYRKGFDKMAYEYMQRNKKEGLIPEGYRSIDAYGSLIFQANGFVDKNGNVRPYITRAEHKALTQGKGFWFPVGNQPSPATSVSSEADKPVQAQSAVAPAAVQILAVEQLFGDFAQEHNNRVVIINEELAKAKAAAEEQKGQYKALQSETAANAKAAASNAEAIASNTKAVAGFGTQLKQQATKFAKQLTAKISGLRNEVQEEVGYLETTVDIVTHGVYAVNNKVDATNIRVTELEQSVGVWANGETIGSWSNSVNQQMGLFGWFAWVIGVFVLLLIGSVVYLLVSRLDDKKRLSDFDTRLKSIGSSVDDKIAESFVGIKVVERAATPMAIAVAKLISYGDAVTTLKLSEGPFDPEKHLAPAGEGRGLEVDLDQAIRPIEEPVPA